MSDPLYDLYQELILDHQKNPRNFGDLPGATHHADGTNPLCGDVIALDLIVDAQGVVTDVKFKGSGCAISRASASLMTQALKGKKIDVARELFEVFHALVTGSKIPKGKEELLGKLKVFSGIREFPARVKCAILAWHTMKAALDGVQDGKVVTTEGNE